jgi:OFA family oxalate/formate antiporter-like MFS transporter
MGGQALEYSVVLKRRWLYLVIGAFSLLLMGFVYGWSILAVPLQDEFRWTSAQLSLVWTASMTLFCFGGLIGSQITRRFSPRVTILAAAVLLFGGYVVSSMIESDGLGILAISYGVCVGGSTGMAHNATLSSVNRWFPDKVGTSSGLLTLGFGLGSLAIGTIAGLGIDALGWRWSFRVIGMVTALVMFGASFFIRIPPPGQILPPAPAPRAATVDSHRVTGGAVGGGAGAGAGVSAGGAGADGAGGVGGGAGGGGAARKRFVPMDTLIEQREYTTRQMLRQKPFYLTFFWAVMTAAAYLSVMGSAKLIALEVGAAMHLATFMVGFISLFDGVGRLSSGLFFDRFGYRPSLIVISVIYLVASVLLYMAVGATALPVVFVGYLLIGLGFGSISTVLAAITNRFYGQKNYASNLALAYMDFVPASIIGPPLVGLIETMSGSYQQGFILLTAFSVLGIISALFIRPPRSKQPSDEQPGA